MRIRNALLVFLLGVSHPAFGGGVPELISKSGFEGKEACVIFDGFGDQLVIPTIHIFGELSLNGAPFPGAENDDAVISLRHRETGDVFAIADTKIGDFSINIVPGRYDVLYSVASKGPTVPRNIGAVLMEDVALLTDTTLDIPVTSYLVGGDLLLNGVYFPAEEYRDGFIHLQGELTGTLQLADTKAQTFANVPVLPGNYEIRYANQSPDSTVPSNKWGFVGLANIVGNDPNLDINVNSIELTGSFSHNGVLMPANEYNDGEFFLENDDGDRALLRNSQYQTYAQHVIPGKYNIYWELEQNQDGDLPINARARVASNVNVVASPLNINLVSRNISGDFLQNGSPFTNDVTHTARMVLKDLADGQETEIGFTHEVSYAHRVVANNYDVIYKYVQGTQVPGNYAAVVERLNVKFDSVFDINVVAGNFGAQIRLDGPLFPADNAQLAFVFLQNQNDPADRLLAGITPQQDLAVRAIEGIYDVYYEYQSGDQIPVNKNALIFSGAGVSIFTPWPPINGGLQLEMESAVLNGSFYRNEALTPMDAGDDGFVEVRDGPGTGRFGNTHDQAYGVKLIKPQEDTIYPLYYAVDTPGDDMPINGDAPIGCFLYEPPPF